VELTIEQALQQAVQAHRHGKLPDAERLYRAILKAQPGHPEANHNLGALEAGAGKPDMALPFLRAAVESRPRQGEFWVSYIRALIDARQPDTARQVLQRGRQLGLGGGAVDRLSDELNAAARTVGTSQARLTPDEMAYQQRVLALRNSPYLEYPVHIHLETLARCNAACTFCPYPTIERQGEKMSDTLIEKIIGDLEDIPPTHRFQLSPFKVNEPFLDTRLFDLLDAFRTRLPNASVTLTSNATPITAKTLDRVSHHSELGYLWISFNDHGKDAYESTMKLPYARTIERLDMIHRRKADGSFGTRVVLSRVGDGSAADLEFARWVKENYPLFEASVFPRGEWLGQVDTVPTAPPSAIGCVRWFDLSITATGIVAHCCMDGKAEHPIGDVRKTHLLEIYNHPDYRRLRESTQSRLDVEPCRRCNFL